MNKETLFPARAFIKALIVNAIWINASEVFRYFAFVMPMMRNAFPNVEDIAPMDLGVFAVWGLWDTILIFGTTGFVWLYLERFGYGKRSAIWAGILFWMTVFVILWLGLFNMHLATARILAITLPLALAEMLVAATIVNWCMRPNATQDA